MTTYRVDAFGVSDAGKVRDRNEDSMLLRSDAGLWAIADGMGGHAHGRWASEQIVTGLSRAPLSGDFVADVERIGLTTSVANLLIDAAAAKEGATIGSTVVIMLLAGARFAILWAGDSRAYLSRGGALIQLTRDHTYVQDLMAVGEIGAEEARSHPKRHMLSRAVGVEADFVLDAVQDEALPRDVFLLCSDGLTGVVSDDEIGERMGAFSSEEAARCLLELALSRGAPDNVTVIVVRCEANGDADG
jgi:serine/threonine-protein phosphatase Stp1